jgi:hypothetical protein
VGLVGNNADWTDCCLAGLLGWRVLFNIWVHCNLSVYAIVFQNTKMVHGNGKIQIRKDAWCRVNF